MCDWCFHVVRMILFDGSNDKSNFQLKDDTASLPFATDCVHTHTNTHFIHVNKKISAVIECSQEVHSISLAINFLCTVFRCNWISNMFSRYFSYLRETGNYERFKNVMHHNVTHTSLLSEDGSVHYLQWYLTGAESTLMLQSYPLFQSVRE